MEERENTYHLLDLSQVDMLLESGTPESVELFTEILGLFEEESQAKLADLRSARAEKNPEAFGNAAHALAGSSANIGGKAVWLKAKEMENSCKNGDAETAYSLLDSLEQEFNETLAQLKSYLGKFQG